MSFDFSKLKKNKKKDNEKKLDKKKTTKNEYQPVNTGPSKDLMKKRMLKMGGM